MIIRISPFSLPILCRIIVKALLVLISLNFICLSLGFDPIVALTHFNTGWVTGHGEARLLRPVPNRGFPVIPISSALAAHEIAYAPKRDDEFRVVFIGDSQTYGRVHIDADTYAGQLTARMVQIGSKRIVAYNLGWPGADLAQSLVIVDAALKYQPDLVILLVTAASFKDVKYPAANPVGWFRQLNRRQLARLTTTFGMENWYTEHIPLESWPANLFAIDNPQAIMTEIIPAWIDTLSYPFVPRPIRDDITRMIDEPIPTLAGYRSDGGGFDPMPNDIWKFLLIAKQLTTQNNVRLLLINEPTFIGSGPNSDVNYSNTYEKALYDRYRSVMADYVDEHGLWYIDLWNIVPPEFFTDTPLHISPEGNSLVIDRIVDSLTTELE